ncbi:MAG: alpha/beta hydrolase [bacterium]|nr:alpha/beta hydrolase [bacterium]
MEVTADPGTSTLTVATADGVRLHSEAVGSGEPILFVHEFAGDHRTWAPQIGRFSRSHRCITYAARGYPPSQVPADPAAYSQQHAVDDALAVLDAHSVGAAHVVGISMGGFCGLHLAVQQPERVRSLVVAGTGYGARPHEAERFRGECDAIAEAIERSGMAAFARQYMCGPSRVQLQNKDPRAWREYTEWLGEHSAEGSAHTMRGVQRERPSLYALEEDLSAVAAPVLVLAGDEDDGCLDTSVWLKRVIPSAGLAVLARSGHTLNIEEPDLLNSLLADFLGRAVAGAWGQRDPRAVSGAITGFS